MRTKDLHQLTTETRARLLRMHFKAKAGHIGGNLSCLEALMVLYHRTMTPEDRFILSKGHSAGAWYAVLWSKGLLSSDRLDSFSRDGGLPGHPSGDGIPGLLFPTGSLGHGPSLANGLALATRHKGLKHRVFCLCSDGEWQEGSNWEALIFMVHHNLDLTLVIDQNGWQGFGRTREVAGFNDLQTRLAAFGLPVDRCPGHDLEALAQALAPRPEGPRAVILDTVKGRGLAEFEDRLESHYLPLPPDCFPPAALEEGEPS